MFTAPTAENAKQFEDAFWNNKPLSRRKITSADVLTAYGNDCSSLRSGFFLQKLCLQNILHGNKKVTPDQVIEEFNREPDRSNKYRLAIARFKSECFLRGLVVNGQQVKADVVVKDFQAVRATLELARFKAECCLKGLTLSGQPVTADAVVKAFQNSPDGKLEIARFKEQCCLRGLLLNGQQVTVDEVFKGFQAVSATLELLRFKQSCCLKRLLLNGQPVTADAVVKDFQAAGATRELARFKAECCLMGLVLNGQTVTPEAVVKDYQAARSTLELARFIQECCLKGLPLNHQPVTADRVVKHYQAIGAILELARFKTECCLRGLVLNGQPVTPEAVVKDCQAARAILELAHFKAECCLRGLTLNGRSVSPYAVVKDFQAARATLDLARFKGQCCLKGLSLNGQQVTLDTVVSEFPCTPQGQLAIAHFKAEYCLRGAGQRVTPDTVVKDFPDSPEGRLAIARFKAECCLRGLVLNGQQVTPEAVVKDYELGGWLLERAIFHAQLALSARALNGNYLDNRKVLAAFNEAPGNHSLRQAEYLMQRLKQSQWDDETNEAQDTIQKAWQILNNVSGKDDHHQLKCILKFMAMHNELTIDHQRVSAEQVLQSIKTLRRSFQTLRLHFFFLAHCHIMGQSVNGRPIHKDQVLRCLQSFPDGCKLKHALGCWFEQFCFEACPGLLFKRENAFVPGSNDSHVYPACASQQKASVCSDYPVSHEQSMGSYRYGCLPGDGSRHSAHPVKKPGLRHHLPDVVPERENDGRSTKPVEVSSAYPGREVPYQLREYRDGAGNTCTAHAVTVSVARTRQSWSTTGRTGFPDKPVPWLTALTLKTLEIIQEVNDSYTDPPILITGSYARFLQNLCSVFNDIDIICTTEKSARTLFDKLQAQNTDRSSEILKSIVIWPIQGCQAIKLPNAYNIHLKDGDLGTRAMGLQVSVDDRVAHEDAASLAIQVPGLERPVRCLSFAEETRLLNDTLEYLADHLDPLTEQLKTGAAFYIPRTILFNFPQNPDERIYGLLMRSLLTLNKARQFIALHSEVNTAKPDYPTNFLQEQQRLYTLTEKVRMKLHSHFCRHDFELRVNNWLSTTPQVNDYGIKRKRFIETLLAMMHPE